MGIEKDDSVLESVADTYLGFKHTIYCKPLCLLKILWKQLMMGILLILFNDNLTSGLKRQPNFDWSYRCKVELSSKNGKSATVFRTRHK